jgi:hypothetical protein
MTPQEFFAVVLPPPGHGLYCAVELTTKRKEHKFEETYDELQQHIDAWVEAKYNTYFALATFEEAGSREATNARHIKSLFVDIDCNEDGPKTYGTKEAGMEAFDAFMQKTGLHELGQPYIIDSGGGYHIYWPLTETQDITSWKPVAENFKRLCKQEGLKIDMTVTADAARVLRWPDTLNFKAAYPEPRPVRILQEGVLFDFDILASAIIGQLGLKGTPPVTAPSNVVSLPGTRPSLAPSATSVKLFENSITRFKNIVKATQAGSGCGQLEHFIENAEDDGMEPLWRGWLSIAQKCEDNEKATVWLSKLHPYDTERMNQKLREIKGPYPCIKFDSENPGICAKCPNWGKITNPLALGREASINTEEKQIEVEAPADSPVAEPVSVKRPVPPKGYAYGEKGGVFQEREIEMADGTKSKKHVMLLAYDLFVVDILNAHGDHTVHMLALRPEGPVDVMVPSKAMVSKDETTKALAQQNVMASFGAGNDKNLFDYVRACVEQAGLEKRALTVPDHYGWQQDKNYVFAGRIFSKGKPPVKVPMPGLENIVSFTEPKGTLEGWRAVVSMLIEKKMYKHLSIMLLGAGAPLMRYTGLAGMTVHCASTESGTGKSLALELAASVWGHPVRYRTGKSTSPVAMQQRLGMLHCHPLISDEITNNNRKDFEWFPGFLLDMSEGKGKERMESGANKERLNLSTWFTIAMLSSNTHGVDWLTGVRKHSSEGELRRLLEYIIEDQLSWTPAEVEIIKSLHQNYGVVGFKMAEYMVDNEHTLSELTNDSVQRMYQVCNATNDERFWMAGIGCAVAAGALWSQKYLGIIDLPLKQIIGAYKDVVNFMRKSMRSNVRTAENVLNSFISENFGKLLVIRRHSQSNALMAEFGMGREADESITRSSISGRVEHNLTPGYCDFFIEEQMMKAHCAAHSFGYAAFCKKLAETNNIMVEFLKKDMTAKTKAPPMRVQAIKVRRRLEDVGEILQNPPALEAA